MAEALLAQEVESDNSNNEKFNFLYNDDNTVALIVLLENACKEYQEKIGRKNVPYSYIRFFLQEFEIYNALFEQKLKVFYDQFKALGISVDDMVERYTHSFYNQSVETLADVEDKFLIFNGPIDTTFTNDMQSISNEDTSAITKNILTICKKMNNHDEVLSKAELYERFMIKETVLRIDDVKRFVKRKAESTSVDDEKPKELVGDAVANNYQSGKITKVVIPKLNLPSAYPIGNNQSRLETKYKATSFYSPSKQIIFINKHKIVNIKYTEAFLNKRKTKKAPNKKFNWDF